MCAPAVPPIERRAYRAEQRETLSVAKAKRKPKNLGELKEAGWQRQTVKQEMRRNLIARMENYECVLDASLNEAFTRNRLTSEQPDRA